MNKQTNVRSLALDILETVENQQAYSNLALNHVMKENQLTKADASLLTELTYGTIQRKLTLDYYLNPFVKNQKKLQSWVLQLLRLTVYQMVYLDRVPDRAAIHEAVEIAKKRGHKGISSLTNGVLRSIQRSGVPSLDDIKDPSKKLSIETSHPQWLVDKWIKDYGIEQTRKMCEINVTAPFQTGRVNLTKTSRQAVIDDLIEEGFQVEPSPTLPEGIRCLRGNMAFSQAHHAGMFTIQDESSMLVAYAVHADSDDCILDACAAPGGKTTHIAETMAGKGKIVALDLHEHKTKLINDQARRLGLENIKTHQLDARKVKELFPEQSFDKVLTDAPCSGLGVIRRKPDAKYTKKPGDIQALAKIQLDILTNVAPLVKDGGYLIYSTCTVNRDENDAVTEQFLALNQDFELDETFSEKFPESVQPYIINSRLQILPHYFDSDGFYIVSFRKRV